MLRLIEDLPIQTEESLKACAHSNGTTETDTEYVIRVEWTKTILLTIVHITALYGLYLCFTSAMWQTLLFAVFNFTWSLIGITAGAHRLWTHRSFKAVLPLRIFLAFWCSLSNQMCIYEWAWTHNLHHKFTETNADPHNSARGFFFAHVGWILIHRHPDINKEFKKLDLRYLQQDPVVRFQYKYYVPLTTFCSLVLPTAIPMMLWGESLLNSLFIGCSLRIVLSLHYAFSINSVAHMWGYRPYDRNIAPRDAPLMKLVPLGEGFHNYHHTFPWDYAASEFGFRFNLCAAFIDLMAWLGLAYDLKTASPEVVSSRILKTGDGSHRLTQKVSESRHLL